MVKEKLLQKIVQLDNCLVSCVVDYVVVNLPYSVLAKLALLRNLTKLRGFL